MSAKLQGKWAVLGGCDHAGGGTSLRPAAEPSLGHHGQPNKILPAGGKGGSVMALWLLLCSMDAERNDEISLIHFLMPIRTGENLRGNKCLFVASRVKPGAL